ncbi:hypothetical protein HMPREF3192_00217 [Atopobium deltae]|uniref:Uncharacterized protein n=1 Tax=Atopobium deltae TaxID=1393034 RepID=A0A133XX84_9ACTN|nr:hypothetical protein HMPREF3192_00217 [Atopobium deltae]
MPTQTFNFFLFCRVDASTDSYNGKVGFFQLMLNSVSAARTLGRSNMNAAQRTQTQHKQKTAKTLP